MTRPRLLTIFSDKIFFRFIAVGIINTIFGTGIMFLLYNVFHFGYWFSSAANYFFGSILSFFLNKRFTFRNDEQGIGVVIKFAVNIALCYFLAYGLARPMIHHFLSSMSLVIADNVSMLLGMGLFVLLNYLSQRLLTFRVHK